VNLVSPIQIAARPAVLSRSQAQQIDAQLAEVFAQVTGLIDAINALLATRSSCPPQAVRGKT
jgi:hypothetical protein